MQTRPRHPVSSKSHTIQDLNKIIDASGLPQYEIAARAGYSQNTVSDLRRHSSAQLHTIENIGKALGYKLQWVPIQDK